MNTTFFKFCGGLVFHFCLIAPSFSQTDTILIEEVTVTDKNLSGTSLYNFSNRIEPLKSTDLSQLIDNIPGFTASQRGHYANEPVLHAFKYDQLNVRFDGNMQVVHACPNRMDPATTHIAPEEIQSIEIIKGPYSVRYGQTLGGIVNLITLPVEFTEENTFKGSLQGGYELNGSGKYGSFHLKSTSKALGFNFFGNIKDYESYSAGNNQVIPSAFSTSDYSIKAGYKLSENQTIILNWNQSFARDVMFAGLPMDGALDNGSMGMIEYTYSNLLKKIFAINVQFYGSDVYHVMNNNLRPNYAASHSESRVSSNTLGGKVEIGFQPGTKTIVYSGLDFQYQHKDGNRVREVYINSCGGMVYYPPLIFKDLIWQDSYINNSGFYTEVRKTTGSRMIINGGVRFDLTASGIGEPAPDLLLLYPEMISTYHDNNYSGHIGFSYQLTGNRDLKILAGRGSRAASLAERYINHFTVGQDAHEYVGNPELKPEINDQANLILQKKEDRYEYGVDIFYSNVTDYITAAVDSGLPRKYMPCQDPPFAKRFQNINRAIITGMDVHATFLFYQHFKLLSTITYTHARNPEWNEPLAEIPPLLIRLKFTYENERFQWGLNARISAKQQRVSALFNESVTPAYQVFDFYAAFELTEKFSITLRVNNLLNALYYDHLSRAYKNYNENSMFYEPGRNIGMSVKYNF